jgi:hypothetical protein
MVAGDGKRAGWMWKPLVGVAAESARTALPVVVGCAFSELIRYIMRREWVSKKDAPHRLFSAASASLRCACSVVTRTLIPRCETVVKHFLKDFLIIFSSRA